MISYTLEEEVKPANSMIDCDTHHADLCLSHMAE